MEDEIMQGQQKTIALVEDDASLITLFSETLSLSNKWRLCVFRDGKTAKEKITSMDVHLIILDIGLPALDGASLYRMLRAHSETRTIPILVITGRQEWELHRMDFQPGYLLQKPFTIQDLLAMIHALIPQ